MLAILGTVRFAMFSSVFKRWSEKEQDFQTLRNLQGNMEGMPLSLTTLNLPPFTRAFFNLSPLVGSTTIARDDRPTGNLCPQRTALLVVA